MVQSEQFTTIAIYKAVETSSDFLNFLKFFIWSITLINITRAKKLARSPTISNDISTIHHVIIVLHPKDLLVLINALAAYNSIDQQNCKQQFKKRLSYNQSYTQSNYKEKLTIIHIQSRNNPEN